MRNSRRKKAQIADSSIRVVTSQYLSIYFSAKPWAKLYCAIHKRSLGTLWRPITFAKLTYKSSRVISNDLDLQTREFLPLRRDRVGGPRFFAIVPVYIVANLQGSFTNLNKAQTFVSTSPTGERAGPGRFFGRCVLLAVVREQQGAHMVD